MAIVFSPAVLVGATQVMLVLDITVGEVQFVPPTVTVAPEMNPVPERVSVVPAVSFPLVGLTVEIVGIEL